MKYKGLRLDLFSFVNSEMDFKVLICALCFVASLQAKPSYNHQDIATYIIKNFKLKDVEKTAENLKNIVGKLKDIKYNYLDHSKEVFVKKSQNAIDLLLKMPKECTRKKAEQVEQISLNGIAKFILCQGFYDALNETETLLAIGENVGIEIAKNLALIAVEVNNCTQKGPVLEIYCLAKILDTVYQQIENIMTVITDYITYASEAVKLIVADIVLCLSQASKLTDDEMALLLEEVKQCTTNDNN